MKALSKIIVGTAMLACLSGQALAFSPHLDSLPAPAFDAKGIARTETVRREYDSKTLAIQVRVDFAPNASFPKHSHPGAEIAYVLKGTIEYEMDGKIYRLKAGESLFIPAGTAHSARNVDADITSELATYLVDKDKPIVVINK